MQYECIHNERETEVPRATGDRTSSIATRSDKVLLTNTTTYSHRTQKIMTGVKRSSRITSASSPIPPRQLNGGLYTGEPFREGAPWRNFSTIPSSEVLVGEQLNSAHPPPNVQILYPSGNERPGNSTIDRPGIRLYDPKRYGDFLCGEYKPAPRDPRMPGSADQPPQLLFPVSDKNQKFAAYASW